MSKRVLCVGRISTEYDILTNRDLRAIVVEAVVDGEPHFNAAHVPHRSVSDTIDRVFAPFIKEPS
jgi:hypothetical protein